MSIINKVIFRQNGLDDVYHIANSEFGYLNPSDGRFYEEATYETEKDGVENIIYIDLTIFCYLINYKIAKK